MQIVIFNWRCFRHPQAGGSEWYLHKQAAIWVKAGHKVVWLTSRSKGAPRREVSDGIEFRRHGGTFSVYLMAALEFFSLGRQADVVVDVENGIPFFTPLYAKCPVILLIHHVHTDVWKREAGWLTARVGLWSEHRAMPVVYRRTPIVTVSESSANMIRELFGNDCGELQIIHNGVSDELRPGDKAPCPEIIYLGRLKRYKSIDVLLRAVSKLGEINPVVHLAGQGDDEPRLKTLAESLGLQKVVFYGFVSDEKKRELLQRSWVAVNPSSMEGWGVTNIEAAACGTPVIGSDVPGIRDSVCPDQSGILFPYGDANVLAQRLRELIENTNRLDQMSRTAVEWADKFSWQKSADTFLDLMQRTLA